MGLKQLFRRRQNADEAVVEVTAGQLEADSNDADRGIPSVNTRRRTTAGTRAMQLLLLLIGLGILVASLKVVIGKMGAGSAEAPVPEAKKIEPEKLGNHAPLSLADSESPGLEGSGAPALPASSPAALVSGGASGEPAAAPIGVRTNPAGKTAGADSTDKNAPLDPDARKLEKGKMYDQGGPLDVRQVAGGVDSLMGSAGGSSSGGNNGLGPMLSSTRTAPSTARALPDPDFYIPKGTVIDCTAQEAIDTAQPGMLNCVGSTDVYSKSQRVVLLERGTIYTIEYQKGLQQGQDRIFLLASTAQTPSNVEVDLDSPVTDSLGRGGIGGAVNTHFWQRFGGAIMLGVISDAGQALVSSVSNGGSQVTVGNTAGGAQQAMAEALRATVNIPPTLEKNQGAHIKLYVARHLDFRSVYALAAK